MSRVVANAANSVLTYAAKMLVKTKCLMLCYGPEAPEELFQK